MLLLLGLLAAQSPDPIRAAVQAQVTAGRIPGAVVHVTAAGRPPSVFAVGDIAPDALFRIASMTKPVTSVAVLMLVEDGKLRLDDPLARYLPEFAVTKVHDGSPPNRAVTVRDLLTHTSGIAYGLNPPPPLKDQFAAAKLADGLNPEDPTLADNTKSVAGLPLAHQPGTAWTYGMNTDVLGRLVEVASGQPFDRVLADRVFAPLKMTDTGFTVPPAKAHRLAALHTPGPDGRVKPITDPTFRDGIVTVAPGRPLGAMKYLSGGAGLVSTAADYTRFLQMLLHEGELDGVRLLKPETVREMTCNQIGKLEVGFKVHGNKFGLGVGVSTDPAAAPVGTYSWGGMYHTFFWVDPARKLTAVVMTQVWPWGRSTLWPDFQKAVYAALGDSPVSPRAATPVEVPTSGRFVRRFWFELGTEHGNPKTNGKFRVNDPLAGLHPEWGKRPETKGNGMMQIASDEPLANVAAAELALELWGGHPGTANKRVTVNGRSTYLIAEVGTAAGHCTHQYPVLRLERSDLVQAHNVFQFACDPGDSFWGHFIVESAALRLELAASPRPGFTARPTAVPDGDGFRLGVELPAAERAKVAGVDYYALYDGFDENGDGRTRDWHGTVKKRLPVGHAGTADAEPFAVRWDTSGLPAQRDMAVRAVVRFADRPDVVYETPAVGGLATAERKHAVKRFPAGDVPKSFWSRDNKPKTCTLPLDVDPATLAAAEVRVVVWDGGVEEVKSPLTLNGKPLPFVSDAKHDVKVLRLAVDPATLVRGANTFRVLSDTLHHGIEVLRPGPELWVTTKPGL